MSARYHCHWWVLCPVCSCCVHPETHIHTLFSGHVTRSRATLRILSAAHRPCDQEPRCACSVQHTHRQDQHTRRRQDTLLLFWRVSLHDIDKNRHINIFFTNYSTPHFHLPYEIDFYYVHKQSHTLFNVHVDFHCTPCHVPTGVRNIQLSW